MAFLSTTLIILASAALISGRFRTPGLVSQYFINWDGGMKACEGSDNKAFDLEKLVVEKKSRSLLALVGDVGLNDDSTEEIKFVLIIKKNINGNYEYMAKIEEQNLCKHISEKKKPWTPFIQEMGISGCPIPKKIYTFRNSTLDTAGFPLTAAQAGHYRARIELHEKGVQKICFIADVVVERL